MIGLFLSIHFPLTLSEKKGTIKKRLEATLISIWFIPREDHQHENSQGY
ncbi:hypothetical protein C2W64_04408 [Brevibacillus laterosporus]|nr:hypothetical protein C2W64_04408 [Brevibacillus laterosporus]